MDRYYGIGPVKLCLRNWPRDVQWPFALWKLDAYEIPMSPADILIEYDGEFPLEAGENWQILESTVLAKRMVQELPGGWRLWQQVQKDGTLLRFAVSMEKRHIVLLQDTTNTFGVGAVEALTFFLYPMLLMQNILTFHSVLLEHKGQGILIAAPSGVGKTTHARLWRDTGDAMIINSDRSPCYREKGKWFAFGTPWCGTGGEQINRTVPVKALVLLRRGKTNAITPMTPMEILNALLPLTACEQGMQARLLELLDVFLKEIPVTGLACTPHPEAVYALDAWLEALP